uniref:Uncharacterized protein n=1 Tax=Fagus sylvatica TaxID=28930 RepID=A0A2N9G2E7_FAGSY
MRLVFALFSSITPMQSLLLLLVLLSLPHPGMDPWTNQVIGIGRKVRRMFELTSLHLPSTPTPPPSHVAHTASIFPLSLWHLHLDSSTILLIPPTNSPVSSLEPLPVVDPVLDQTSFLPLDAPPDLPLGASPIDSLVSPQEPTPPVDVVIDQTPPLPLRHYARVRAPSTHLRDYSCFQL